MIHKESIITKEKWSKYTAESREYLVRGLINQMITELTVDETIKWLGIKEEVTGSEHDVTLSLKIEI